MAVIYQRRMNNMKTREVTNNRGETFKLTEDEERYYHALKKTGEDEAGKTMSVWEWSFKCKDQ